MIPVSQGRKPCTGGASTNAVHDSNSSITSTENNINNFTPVQMMATPNFYFLFAMCGLAWTSTYTIYALYKAYALEEVTTDDHFLSVVGLVVSMLSMANQFLWGLL